MSLLEKLERFERKRRDKMTIIKEIINLLLEEESLTPSEIAERLVIPIDRIYSCLFVLREKNIVEEIIDGKELYKHKLVSIVKMEQLHRIENEETDLWNHMKRIDWDELIKGYISKNMFMRMYYIGKRSEPSWDNIHFISNYEDKTMERLIQLRGEKLQQYQDLDEKIREFKKAKTGDLKSRLINQEKTINKLKKEREEKYIKILEKSLQRLLVKFPQIIEPSLLFVSEYYKLGNSNWEGDLLFRDLDDKKVNIEIKVKVPSYNSFKEQLVGKYIPNIDINKERLMYIAPRITKEQRNLCREYSIEWKEININKILNSWKR